MTDDPVISRKGAGWFFQWQKWPLNAKVDRIREEKDSVKAELTLKARIEDQDVHLYQSVLNLTSQTARRTAVKHLGELHGEDSFRPDWTEVLETVCLEVLRRLRMGEPLRIIRGDAEDYPLALSWRLKPLVLDRHPTILFGEGGLAKSWFALWCGLLGTQGVSRCGLTPVTGNWLYLDWETSEEEVNRRVAMLKNGERSLANAEILYRRCAASLADELDEIMDEITGCSVQGIVIDSLLGACGGGELQKEATPGAFFRAFRRLNVGGLIIGHTQKGSLEKTVFGSAFWQNQARSVWEAVGFAEPGEREIYIGLKHNKVNIGRKHTPLAFRFAFSDDDSSVVVSQADYTEIPGMEKGVSLGKRIQDYLKAGTASLGQIAESLESGKATVAVTLSRLKKRGLVLQVGEGWGVPSHETG